MLFLSLPQSHSMTTLWISIFIIYNNNNNYYYYCYYYAETLTSEARPRGNGCINGEVMAKQC